VELWPKDGWSVCSRPAGVVYAGCILASLAAYAYINRIAPVAGSVSIIILALVLAAFACLAGTSGQTWTDPSNALAVLLIACAFLLDGFFIAGARTFGPTKVLDVGIGSQWDFNDSYFSIDGHWIEAKLPGKMSYDEWAKIRSWSENLELTNDLDSKPGRVQISMFDRQVYWITMKNWNPPTTIGEPPHANIRAFLELLVGLVLLVLSSIIWREGRRRGIRYHKYDPFMLLAEQSNSHAVLRRCSAIAPTRWGRSARST
jgi:Na+(H+)/acetate symporter ActP